MHINVAIIERSPGWTVLKEDIYKGLVYWLQQAGYVTGLIGKWHQGYTENSDNYHPQNHGFDEFVGYHSGNVCVTNPLVQESRYGHFVGGV